MSKTRSFRIATGTADQWVEKTGASYPPTGTLTRDTTETYVYVRKSKIIGTYYTSNMLLSFNTENIPANATVQSARLIFYTNAVLSVNNRNLLCEGYAWDGTSATDFAENISAQCFSVPIVSLDDANGAGATNTIPLNNAATVVNKSGNTLLRLGISGDEPNDHNVVLITTYENSFPAAKLEVTYTDPSAYRSKSEGSGSATNGGTISVTLPAASPQDDTLLLAISYVGGTNFSLTPPGGAGWTLVQNQNSGTSFGTKVYKKTVGASDAGPWSFSTALTSITAAKYAWACLAYDHEHGPPSVDTSSGQANASSTSVVAPTITPPLVDSQIIYVGGLRSGGASGAVFTPPSGMTERADVTSGTSVGTPAAKTFYMMGSALTNSMQSMQEDGTAPADAAFTTAATGWILSNTAGGNYSELRPNVERAANTFNTTVVPTALGTGANANAFRTPAALTGSFAAGNWTLSAVMRSVTAAMVAGQTGRMRWRVFRSANADGTSATEITTAAQVTNTVAGTGNTTANHAARTVTWNAPAITLNNEYLFFAVAWEVVANSGSGTTRDVNFRQNSGSSVATTAFSPTNPDVSIEVGEVFQEPATSTGTKTGTATSAAINTGVLLSLSSPDTLTVSKTASLLWNARQSVEVGVGLMPSDTLTPDVGLTPLGPGLHLLWNVDQAVAVAGQSRSILYNVNGLSGQTRTLLYNISGLTRQDRQVLYNISGRAGQSRTVLYDLNALAGGTRQVLYNVSGRAGAQRAILYNISSLAGAERQILYDILASALLAGASRQVLFDVRALAAQSRSLLYNVNGLAGQQRSLLYNISTKAGAQRQLLYDLRALAGQSRPVLYNVNGLATGTRTILYNVSGLAGQQRVVLYNVSGRAGQQRQILYNILANSLLAGASRQVLYDVRGLARGNRDLLFNVNGLAHQDRQIRYDIYTKAGASRTLLYNLRALAGAQRNVLYDVRGLVRADRQLLYDVYGKAGAQRILRYDINALAGAQRDILYDLRGLAGADRQILYNVLSHIITLLYDLEISVDSPLSLAELAAEEAIAMETEVTR